ncbi:hypothetical protein, partial [Xenorhabdus sp. TS4]|uniref:hypothetical protein n=1 Tax=Xenorhabdus sp. TS4 TaxID=1873483 RepID=UPI001CA3FF52
ITLKMATMERIHTPLLRKNGYLSLLPSTICNSARCSVSHLSLLGQEPGDYIWRNHRTPASDKFRRLRPAKVEKYKKQA